MNKQTSSPLLMARGGRSLAHFAAHSRSLAVLLIAGILAVKSGMECYSTIVATYPDATFLPSLLYAFVVWFWWALVALVLWAWSERSAKPLGFHPATILAQLTIGCTLTGLHVLLLSGTLMLISKMWPSLSRYFAPSLPYDGGRFTIDLTIYAFIYVFSSLIRSQLDARRSSMQRSELERQLSQAQLHALQMQLEPHFLFNTLNSISSLVDLHRNEEASEAIAHLNTILRLALERGTPAKIPLHEEFTAVQSYLAIQQMRFADRLEVRFDTTPEALDGLVPCFLLQPIVENAIQHGIAPMKRGGVLEASACRTNGKLQLTVRDNGNTLAKTATKGHGIGLNNTRERLNLFYPDEHTFQAARGVSGGYQVFIEIPYEELPA